MSTWTNEHLGIIREIMIRMDKADLRGFESMFREERPGYKVGEADTKGQFLSILAEITQTRKMKDGSVLNMLRAWVISMQMDVRDEVMKIVQSTINELETMLRDKYVEDVIAASKELGIKEKMPDLGMMGEETILSLTSELPTPNIGLGEDSGTG